MIFLKRDDAGADFVFMGSRFNSLTSPSIDCLESRRLLAFATPVSGFGDGGIAGAGTDVEAPYTQHADGKIIALAARGLATQQYLTRFRLDRSFGTDGFAALDFRPLNAFQTADGKIIGSFIYGSIYGGGSRVGTGVYRLNADGTPDTSYGKNGTEGVRFNLSDIGLIYDDDSYAVAAPDGSLFIVAQTVYY